MTRDAAELHRLARDLGVTEMQRRFLEILAADPNRNATRAALAAGAGKGAAVTASKWLKLAKVKSYLQAVVAAAFPGALAENEAASASLSEVLAILSAQALGKMAAQVRERGDQASRRRLGDASD